MFAECEIAFLIFLVKYQPHCGVLVSTAVCCVAWFITPPLALSAQTHTYFVNIAKPTFELANLGKELKSRRETNGFETSLAATQFSQYRSIVGGLDMHTSSSSTMPWGRLRQSPWMGGDGIDTPVATDNDEVVENSSSAQESLPPNPSSVTGMPPARRSVFAAGHSQSRKCPHWSLCGALARSNGTHDEERMTEEKDLDDVELGESGVTMSSSTAQEDLHDGTGSAQARLAPRTVAKDSAYMSRKMGAIREYLREDIDEYLKLGPAGYLQASHDEGVDTSIRFHFIKLLSVGWRYEFGELDKA